ncbi:MAG: hypothetical protein LBR68_04590 [Lachnoclostridium sp.]|jgi:flavodoxin|nr:hypothetical protein [Lachnoclostridium sp.]
MKTLVIYYSYSGHTKEKASSYAKEESAELTEIKDGKRPGKLKAYIRGCFAAIRGKAWPIQPIDMNLTSFEHLTLFSPVWAGHMPPAVNALIEQLPNDITLSVRMVSSSGESDCKERLERILKSKGCTLADFENMKS